MTLLILWLLVGLAASMVASSKGRSGVGWFVLGLLFGPLALLLAAAMSKDSREIELRQARALAAPSPYRNLQAGLIIAGFAVLALSAAFQ